MRSRDHWWQPERLHTLLARAPHRAAAGDQPRVHPAGADGRPASAVDEPATRTCAPTSRAGTRALQRRGPGQLGRESGRTDLRAVRLRGAGGRADPRRARRGGGPNPLGDVADQTQALQVSFMASELDADTIAALEGLAVSPRRWSSMGARCTPGTLGRRPLQAVERAGRQGAGGDRDGAQLDHGDHAARDGGRVKLANDHARVRRRRRVHRRPAAGQPGRRVRRRRRAERRADAARGPGAQPVRDGVPAPGRRRRGRPRPDLHPDTRASLRRTSRAGDGVRARRAAAAATPSVCSPAPECAGRAPSRGRHDRVRRDGAADPDLGSRSNAPTSSWRRSAWSARSSRSRCTTTVPGTRSSRSSTRDAVAAMAPNSGAWRGLGSSA